MTARACAAQALAISPKTAGMSCALRGLVDRSVGPIKIDWGFFSIYILTSLVSFAIITFVA